MIEKNVAPKEIFPKRMKLTTFEALHGLSAEDIVLRGGVNFAAYTIYRVSEDRLIVCLCSLRFHQKLEATYTVSRIVVVKKADTDELRAALIPFPDF